MGTIDQVISMKREGRSDEEIISNLRKQGISPKEINDALNHAQIKNAVSDVSGNDMPLPPLPEEYSNQQQQEEAYTPQDYGQYPQQGQDQNQGPEQQTYAPQSQEYYQQGQGGQGYDYGQYPQQQQQISTDTITDIAEQVFSEKINDSMKKIESFDEFKSLTQAKVEQLDDRLKRIESIIDKIQSAIIEKIGSYGNNLESIKKEMSMMQDSFSKALPSMVERGSRGRISEPENEEETSEEEEPEKVSNVESPIKVLPKKK